MRFFKCCLVAGLGVWLSLIISAAANSLAVADVCPWPAVACPTDELPDLPGQEIPLSASDQQYLEDFGTALRRFKNQSTDAFFAEYSSRKTYLTGTLSYAPRDAEYLDGILTQYPLSEDQLGALDDNGFVIAADHDVETFFGGLKDVFEAHLPLYISVDLLLDALHLSFDEMLLSVEEEFLIDRLDSMLTKLDRSTELLVRRYSKRAFIRGDANADGTIGLTDAVCILSHLFTGQDACTAPPCEDALDVDDSGELSISDAIALLEYSFDGGGAPPAPFPEKGLDPTPDDLSCPGDGVDIDEELDDVAMWICTARSLLAGRPVRCKRDMGDRVEEMLEHVDSEQLCRIELFGAEHCEDFSQFRPRGHYTRSEDLQRYFRAMTWTQRIGMKFAQFPRHARVAHLLTRALYDTGAIRDWKFIDDMLAVLVGTSDSLNPPGWRRLIEDAGVETLADYQNDEKYLDFVRTALETGAGKQLINSQILAGDPESVDGFTPIPPTFHVMGQRFIVDSFVFTNVVDDRVPGRCMPSPLDAWFVLGNRATLPLLRDEIGRHAHHPQLAALEWLVSGYDDAFWSGSTYNLWLSALRTLNADTTGDEYPEVMRTPTWDKRMLHAQLASWSHLRHDTIAYAKPSYTATVCDYPEGWVDPYPEFYEALTRFADRSLVAFEDHELFENLSEWERENHKLRRYFEALRDHSQMLEGIARAELAEEELSEQQRDFIKGALSRRGCAIGQYNGWYLELLFGSPIGVGTTDPGLKPTVADIHTHPGGPLCRQEVLHVGVGRPNLCVITVDNSCGKRAYVGPVLSYYEFKSSGLVRMNDEEWLGLLRAGSEPPRPEWVESFVR